MRVHVFFALGLIVSSHTLLYGMEMIVEEQLITPEHYLNQLRQVDGFQEQKISGNEFLEIDTLQLKAMNNEHKLAAFIRCLETRSTQIPDGQHAKSFLNKKISILKNYLDEQKVASETIDQNPSIKEAYNKLNSIHQFNCNLKTQIQDKDNNIQQRENFILGLLTQKEQQEQEKSDSLLAYNKKISELTSRIEQRRRSSELLKNDKKQLETELEQYKIAAQRLPTYIAKIAENPTQDSEQLLQTLQANNQQLAEKLAQYTQPAQLSTESSENLIEDSEGVMVETSEIGMKKKSARIYNPLTWGRLFS